VASYLTSTSILESIKTRGLIPTNQATFTDQKLLDLANEEMMIGLVPMVMQFHQEYLMVADDVPLVTDQFRYPIPGRAVGNKLRDLYFIDNSNNLFEMTRLNYSDIAMFNNRYISNRQYFFWVEDNEVVLLTGPNSIVNGTGTLRFAYYRRPNQLVLQNRVGFISSIDLVNNSLMLSATPSVFSITANYDLIQAKSPFKNLATDATISAIAGTNIIFSTSLPPSLAVGDYLCLAEETFVPQVPTELHSIIPQRVVARVMEALGDVQALQAANTKLGEMEQKSGTLIDNRVEGTVLKVFPKFSTLRQASYYRRRRSTF